MKNTNLKRIKRKLRHERATSKLTTSADRLRLSVYKSNAHIFAQIIDDEKHITVASSSTLELDLAKNNVDSAKQVGTDIAKKAIAKGVKKIAFDTGGSRYHGKVKALADAARAGGLEF
jgi:large subunit ribosomal protein L18